MSVAKLVSYGIQWVFMHILIEAQALIFQGVPFTLLHVELLPSDAVFNSSLPILPSLDLTRLRGHSCLE